MAVLRNLVGKRFGALEVVSYSRKHIGPCGASYHYWIARCDCGQTIERRGSHLTHKKRKEVQSCGCLIATQCGLRTRTHGLKSHSAYNSWVKMLHRCTNPDNKDYINYGGRGITVCARWHDVVCFIEDMGEKPKGCSIERLNNDLGYNKENCVWATMAQQNRNKRSNRIISLGDRTMHLVDWAKHVGISVSALHQRLARMPIERALNPKQ